MFRKLSTEIASEGENIFKEKIFNRRAFIAILGQIFGAFIIFFRLINLQIYSKKKYEKMSNQNQYRPNFIIPRRGRILDINNIPVAHDRMCYNVLLQPNQFKYLEKVINGIVPLLNKSRRPKDLAFFIKKAKNKIKQNPSGNLILWKSITKEEIARIEYIAYQLPDFEIKKQSNRIYPFGSLTSSIVGYLRHTSKNTSIKSKKAMLRLINQDHKEGEKGIEKIMNNKLIGSIGLEITKVDAFGSVVYRKIHTEPKRGKDVKITIDTELQKIASEAIGNRSGSVSLIDLKTSEQLVMASTPSFDPKIFDEDIDQKEWSNIRKYKNVFSNRNLSIAYNPGSTFKLVSGLNGLRNGLDPYKTFVCKGYYKFGSRIFHCWKKSGHGKVNLIEAIGRSCNAYFYHLGSQTDIEQLHNTAIALGLGHNYTLNGMPNNNGIIPNSEWKKNRFGAKWIPGETINTVIGQGYTECTPLQLSCMISRIASSKVIDPKLIQTKDTVNRPLLIQQEYIDIIKKGIMASFTDPEGTCRFHFEKRPEYMMAGKTGTAQVISLRMDNKEMDKVSELLWPHGLFVGYAPYENPRFGVSAVIENGRSGGVCIPIARTVIKAALDKYN